MLKVLPFALAAMIVLPALPASAVCIKLTHSANVRDGGECIGHYDKRTVLRVASLSRTCALVGQAGSILRCTNRAVRLRTRRCRTPPPLRGCLPN